MRIKTSLALALAGALSIGAATATTLQQLSLREMAVQAEVAIVGEVTSSSATKTDSGIATLTKLKVIDSAWGASQGAIIEVQTPGGSIQSGKFKVGEGFAGNALMARGESSVFLLKADSASGKYVIVGFNQGKLQMVKGAKGIEVLLPGSGLVPLATAMAELKSARLAPASRVAP